MKYVKLYWKDELFLVCIISEFLRDLFYMLQVLFEVY